MPAVVSWPQRIRAGKESWVSVSTLDVVPTVLSIVNGEVLSGLDGVDISAVLFDQKDEEKVEKLEDRVLFFWRDGFATGPLPPPYGRFDVAAAKLGRHKAWFYTKSAHYNQDVEVYHDPPLLFDVVADASEAKPLDVDEYMDVIDRILEAVKEHKKTVEWGKPLGLATDPKYFPCASWENKCRTSPLPRVREWEVVVVAEE